MAWEGLCLWPWGTAAVGQVGALAQLINMSVM